MANKNAQGIANNISWIIKKFISFKSFVKLMRLNVKLLIFKVIKKLEGKFYFTWIILPPATDFWFICFGLP